MKSKLVRSRVVIPQPSLELLAELNMQAEKVDCAVVIGVLPKGTPMLGGETMNNTPFYMVLEKDLFKDTEEALDATHIGFTRDEVLSLLLDRAKKAD